MATPTPKNPVINRALIDLFGVDRVAAVTKDVCIPAPIGCGKPIGEFRDETSQREYTISGMCQKCQDSVFGV